MSEKLWSTDFIRVCVANFLMASSFHLLMPTIPIYLMESLRVPHSKVGIVMSSYTLAMLMVRPFSGYLVDVFNRKKLFILSLTLFVLTFFGYFIAWTFLLMIIVRFIHGAFWSMSTVSSNTMAIDLIPSSRRAEGVGYFGMNMNLAMAIAPFFAISIYESFGFFVLVSCSILVGGLSIFSAFLIRPPHRELSTTKPPLSLDRFILLKGLPIFFNQVLVTIGWGMLVAYAVLYGKELGLKNAGMIFLFIAAGLILSRITSGKYVDKGHLHGISLLALLIVAVSLFCFATFHTVYSFCISAFFIGVGYGTMLPAFQTIFINMAPNDRRGTANSTYLTAFDLGMGIGMLAGGFLRSLSNSMSLLFYVAFALALCAVFVYLLWSRRVYEKNKVMDNT